MWSPISDVWEHLLNMRKVCSEFVVESPIMGEVYVVHTETSWTFWHQIFKRGPWVRERADVCQHVTDTMMSGRKSRRRMT